MKRNKKEQAILTFLFILFSLSSLATACNKNRANPETDFEFFDEAITQYIGTTTIVIIPNVIQGQSVKQIQYKAFEGKQLEEVAIPNSVTMIMEKSFENNKLTSITIPDSVTLIGAEAFKNNLLAKITIGENVELAVIPGAGFTGNDSFDNLFDKIYNHNGKRAGTYSLNDGIWLLGEVALTFPQEEEEPVWTSWSGDQVEIDSELKWWDEVPEVTEDNVQIWRYHNSDITATWIRGTLTISGTGDIAGSYSDNSYPWHDPHLEVFYLIIEEGITGIGDDSFFYKQLESVTIPNTVTHIGISAFSSNQLTSVVIPDSVTYIDNAAFGGNKLTSVTISNSVTWLGHSAFSRNQLTHVTIPNSVKAIGDNTFTYNPLRSVTIGANVKVGDVGFAFEGLFERAYNSGGRLAGTYTYADRVWTKQ